MTDEQTKAGAVLPIGPRALPVQFTCAGCPALCTQRWTDYLDNDETDSGTSARCKAANEQVIASYWHDGMPPPAWCPASTPQPPLAGSVEERRLWGYALERCMNSQRAFAARLELANPGDPYVALAVLDDVETLEKLRDSLWRAAPAPKESHEQ